MPERLLKAIAAVCLFSSASEASPAAAQGITSGGVRGTVRSAGGHPLDGARIRVVNTATGFAVRTQAVGDRFMVQGLEPGGPYVIEASHIGFLPQRSRPLPLTLGEPITVAFVLQPAAVQLAPLDVHEAAAAPAAGLGTTVPEALVSRLPTLNRNFQDFVALAPHVSTKVGGGRTGVSGAGANLRFNSFVVNGADERVVNGSVSAASTVGKSIPLDAVKEYQVLVAPYDVRYGDFAGALVNTVTRSGGNELRGSAFGYWRNDRLARGGDDAAPSPYDRLQYGLSLGGPLLKDRAHFFAAAEIQHLSQPADGPYAGQPAGRVPPLPVAEGDLARLQSVLRDRYGLTPGSAGYVEHGTPLRNLFGRVDVAFPAWNSRIMAFATSARAGFEQFSRAAADTFPLSSYRFSSEFGLDLTALQVHTDLPRARGGHNELLVSFSWDRSDAVPDVRQPLVRVLMSGTAGGTVLVNAGSAEGAQGRYGLGRSFKVREEITLPSSAGHVLVAGVQVERFRVLRGGVVGGYGIWTFGSVDALEEGVAGRYELRKDFGTASTPLRGGQYAAYVADEWRPNERLSVTAGLRADLLDIDGQAPYSPGIDSIFGRRTDRMRCSSLPASASPGIARRPGSIGSAAASACSPGGRRSGGTCRRWPITGRGSGCSPAAPFRAMPASRPRSCRITGRRRTGAPPVIRSPRVPSATWTCSRRTCAWPARSAPRSPTSGISRSACGPGRSCW